MTLNGKQHMTKTSLSLIVIAALANSVSQAQMPAIRQLGPVTAVGKDSLGAITTVRQLPGGRVLVAFSRGADTPIYVPDERLRAELGSRGFAQFADFAAGDGTALVARKREGA